jgi:mannose-6-phosphate isomerase
MLALTPFTAMCGFKSLSEISHLFDELGMLSLFPGLNKNLKAFFTDYLNLDEAKVITPSLIEDIKSLRRLNPDMNYILGWVIELYKQYGLHSGILAPLFLNTIQLQPGEAVFIDAGVLHAYLQGSGLELMANSDNVLRCGLTPKYIDKNELLNILDFEHHPPTRIIPQTCNNELIYRTPAAEFELSRIDIYPGVEYNYQIQSGEILLCLNGECIISDCAKLKRGESVFVSADSGDLVITGEALLYRAKTPARKTFS